MTPRSAEGRSPAAGCIGRVRNAHRSRTGGELDALRVLTRALHCDPGAIWGAMDRYGGVERASRAVGGRRAGKSPGHGRPATPAAHTVARPAEPAAEGSGSGDRALPFWDPRYPARLWRLPDPPPLLFARGDLSLLDRPSLAIVGTRRCSEHGRSAARAIALAVGARGVVVVSGHAQGIDAAAHDAALATGTVAVLGCGLDMTYPRALGRLRERIEQRGLLLSEFSPGTAPLPRHFPRRNRLIAALAHGVVVVEAPHRSGAQNTVSHALDLGLDVGAVPGPIDRANCAGSNRLLREGAAAICEPAHALELLELPVSGLAACPTAGSRGPEAGTPAVDVLALLRERPATPDEVAEALRMDVGAASATLLELELAGNAVRGHGGRFLAPGAAGDRRRER